MPMLANLAPEAVARRPTQKRALDRFEKILDESHVLLAEQGLHGFSIPTLAERLGYTRGSIYSYFPTPFAILNELVMRYLAELEEAFLAQADTLGKLNVEDSIVAVVDLSVAFYNERPVARLLILGGAVSDDSYRAQESLNKRLGALGRAMWFKKMDLPPNAPDIFTLSADLGTACFRRSCFDHGDITPTYRQAAIDAMRGFLLPYAQRAAAKASR